MEQSSQEIYKRPKQRHEKIALATPHTRTSSYQALSYEQSLEKNKIIGKLTLLERKGFKEQNHRMFLTF